MSVFLSHAAGDITFANRLRGDLRKEGVEVLSAEDVVRPGESWIAKIISTIEAADTILAVVSGHLVQSQSSSAEIAIAISEVKNRPTKRIIPVLADKSSELPFFLKDIQYVDLSSEESYRRNLALLIRSLREPPQEDGGGEQLEEKKLDYLHVDRAALDAEVNRYEVRRAEMIQYIITLFRTASISIILAILMSMMAASLFRDAQINSWFLIGVLAGVLASFLAPEVLKKLDDIVAALFKSGEEEKEEKQKNER